MLVEGSKKNIGTNLLLYTACSFASLSYLWLLSVHVHAVTYFQCGKLPKANLSCTLYGFVVAFSCFYDHHLSFVASLQYWQHYVCISARFNLFVFWFQCDFGSCIHNNAHAVDFYYMNVLICQSDAHIILCKFNIASATHLCWTDISALKLCRCAKYDLSSSCVIYNYNLESKFLNAYIHVQSGTACA